ncbi:MAG TPA: tripartite tricarboxylate transporter substrate binding protein [Burkholderiales bacterium]|jgi:tripartite-type tricarboxylate transporter receptor subunit TctC|nr:tripartite tricarboxylate transporter substrate binding protein [Burkholderiales bacterium]
MKNILATLICAAAGLAATAPAYAQQYPDKPIRIIVGPGPDTLARLLGAEITKDWGQQVLVDQRPAAGGIVAADVVAKAAPDGYTLLLSTGSFTINTALNAKLPYDFLHDLTPVSLMATFPFILVVRPDAPYHSLKDLVEAARAQPGKLNYASAGNGTPPHLAGEMLKQMANINMVHVPYKGAAPAITDLIGGQVQTMFGVAPAALPQVKGGKLRALAVSSQKRYVLLPDVPSVAESGYPDFQVVGWNGLHAPAKTPKAIIDKLNAEVARYLKSKEAQEPLLASGFVAEGSTVAEFDAFARADIARATQVIKTANIHVD